MGLDLNFEEAVTADEINTTLKLAEKELEELEGRGLPFVQTEFGHIYLTSSILEFLKKEEITLNKEVEE